MSNPKFVVYDHGVPVAGPPDEMQRIGKRMRIIIQVFKEMGIELKTVGDYNTEIQKLVATDFKKYMKFLDEVDKRAKKEGC